MPDVFIYLFIFFTKETLYVVKTDNLILAENVMHSDDDENFSHG